MTSFIPGCPPTKATGWRPVITVTAFGHMFQGIGDRIEMDTGFGPIMAGTGTQTSVSLGPPTIMAGGPILVGPVGAGSPELDGLQPGSRGDRVTKRLAGLLYRQRQKFRGMDRFLPGRTRSMALDPLLTLSSAILIGTSRIMPGTSSPLSETFRSSGRRRMSLTLLPPTIM
jgi:hypothetical protein